MKLKIDIELSPEEARKMMGLPDMGPIWDKTFGDSGVLKDKLVDTIKKNMMNVVDPFNVTKWKQE